MHSPDEPGLPPSPSKPLASWYAQGVSDGLGDRLLMFDNSDAPSLELLRFRRELARLPGFEAALRDQLRRLDRFRHPAFARMRSVQRLEPDNDLALISNCTPGKRLSEILHAVRGPAFAATLIRQLAPALLAFQQHDGGTSHGVLSPDRIIVAPDGQLTIVEHAVGAAIDTLNLRNTDLRSLGIALPPAAGTLPRLDVATDWYQLGLVAVSVLLGRPVTAGDLPQLEAFLDSSGHSAGSDGPALSLFIREWLEHALQLSGPGIQSRVAARAALEELVRKEQSRDALRIEPGRVDQAAAPAPSPADLVDPSADVAAARTPEILETGPVVVTPVTLDTPISPVGPVTPITPVRPVAPPRQALADRDRRPRPIVPAAPPLPEPVEEPSLFEPRAPREAQRQAEVLGLFDRAPAAQARPPLEPRREPAARPPTESPPFSQDPHAGPPPIQFLEVVAAPSPRTGVPTSVVAVLMLIVAAEAAGMAWLARTPRSDPKPAMAVETAASGENVVVSNQVQAPLRITTAPDLTWVRVTSAPSPGAVGAAAADKSGIIRISSPIKLKVFEGTRQLGSVPGADLKVAPGPHEIELVNAELGYSLKQSLDVEAGQTASIHVAPPQGSVTLYSVPASEVSIDGQPVGRTPLGPLSIAAGEHVVIFRHPAGFTDRQRVIVKSGEGVRVIGNIRRR